MFKGSGTVSINVATVRVALQEYFDRHYAFGSAPEISRIQAKVQYNGSLVDLESLSLDVSERLIVMPVPLELPADDDKKDLPF